MGLLHGRVRGAFVTGMLLAGAAAWAVPARGQDKPPPPPGTVLIDVRRPGTPNRFAWRSPRSARPPC